MLANWDELEEDEAELGHLSGRWTNLTEPVGATGIGANRIRVTPDRWATPAHIEGGEEEIFFVLRGSGYSWQQLGAAGEPKMHELRPNDCIVHLAGRERHTLLAGPDGLDVIAFGDKVDTTIGYLPRAQVAWLGGTWVDAGGGDWPWQREVNAGPPEIVEPSERPANIKNVDEAPAFFDGAVRAVADAAGSQRSGLNYVRLDAGQEGAPPHCHSAEHELFVVLDGTATLYLTPTPARREFGAQDEEHDVRAGSIVSRPAGTGICHHFVAGVDGLTMLTYGTRDANDIRYYPRDNQVVLKGVGVRLPL